VTGVGIEAGGSRGEFGHIISVIISVIIYNNSIIIYNSLLCMRFEFEAAASRSKGRISERSEYNDVYNL